MSENGKKLAMAFGVVVCLALASLLLFNQFSRGSRIPDSFGEEAIWVKCANQTCGASWQINKKEYFEYVEQNRNPLALGNPPLECGECGEASAYIAIKCEQCGSVFFKGTIADDFSDRCPECGLSKTEQSRRDRN